MIVATPKRPTEAYSIAVEFVGKLPAATSLASGTLNAVNRTTGLTDNTVLASTTATISGTQAIFKGQVGTSPTDYLITLTVTLNDGSVLVEEVLLQVRLAMTLVATAGAVTANSYATRAEADVYHQTHLYNATWLAADDWQREAALIWATRLLDHQLEWEGEKVSGMQALRWPRAGVTDRDGWAIDSATIPVFLKHATAELARYLILEDRTSERSYGISSVTADVVTVNFDKLDAKPVLPESVLSLVRPYGSVSGTSSSGAVKLVRA